MSRAMLFNVGALARGNTSWARRSMQLTAATINPKVKSAQYAVRGAIVLRAMEHEAALRKNAQLPFDEVIYCNVGNPQQLNQKPITFYRQVLALCDCPDLLNSPAVAAFPPDVIQRVKDILAQTPGGTGAYSESKGLRIIRDDVVKFINERDGVKADPEEVFLTDGASQGVSVVLNLLIRDQKDGIMIPFPQYPLYTASISLMDGQAIGYYLNEEKGWSMEIPELKRSLKEARDNGTNVRALAVINPGNPTGQNMLVEDLRAVVKFCEEENLFLLADEVYQANVYGENNKFTSFRKVITEMNSKVEVASFHSVSKGVAGECGRRGGYVEFHNVDQSVLDEIYKLFSIGLCSNISGQVMVDVMVNPPKPGEPSYKLYKEEVDMLYNSLARRSQKLYKALNEMKNISCAPIEGALYAFPSINLPPKAIEAAKAKDMVPDAFYAVELLDNTGICVVPGSGFTQRPGTWHFRTTFLPEEHKMDAVIEKLKKFNESFMSKYE